MTSDPGGIRSLATAAVAIAVAVAPAPAQPPYAEAIVVRELEVLFDDSVLPPLESLGRRADGDFTVLLDGIPLPPAPGTAAAGAERLGEALLWFDADLASPAALAAAARELAYPPPSIDGAERRRVVFVGPGGSLEEVDDPSPERLAGELSRRARDWGERHADSPTLERRLRALDRLAARLASRGGGRRALVVAADPWSVDAESLNDLAAIQRGEPPRDARLQRLEEVARLLAAAGWTVVPLSVPPGIASDAWPRAEDGETVVVDGDEKHRFAWFTFPVRDRPPSARVAVQLAVATDFGLRPWAHVARASWGTLAGDRFGLERALARLAARRRLVVSAPDRPPGPLLPLEVRWTGGDGRPLPAARWVASGHPPESAAVRLRALVAGDLAPGDGESVSFRSASAATSACLPAPPAEGGTASTWLRASVIVSRPGGPDEIVRGETVEVAPVEGRLCAALPPLPAPDPAPAAAPAGSRLVLVESLDADAWGAAPLASSH